MKEKHIRIDMDLKSSPVWFSSDGRCFVNGSIEELSVSSKLKKSLKNYKDIWHDYKKGQKTLSSEKIYYKFKRRRFDNHVIVKAIRLN